MVSLNSIDYESRRLVGRRAFLMTALQVACMGFLSSKLVKLQFLDYDKYHNLADNNLHDDRIVRADRANIVDINNKILATNIANHRISYIGFPAEDTEQVLITILQQLEVEPKQRAKILQKFRKKQKFIVADNIKWEKFYKIYKYVTNRKDFQIETIPHRYYPYAEVAAHLLGYINRVDIEGVSGIEQMFDQQMFGVDGQRQVTRNASGRVMAEKLQKKPVINPSLQITLDIDLQQYAYGLLTQSNQAGSITVIDINDNCAVRCIASNPAYDNNRFVNGFSHDEWQQLTNNGRAPFIFKPIQGQYAPGSTFKMIVALAGLEKKVINSRERIFCSNNLKIGNRRFYCWEKDGHGSMNLIRAITNSCDVYFYELANRMAIEDIMAMAHRFGLGQSHCFASIDEKIGILPDSKWKREKYDQEWIKGDTILAGIGQGYILTTPLQLAVMTARVLTNRAVTPHIHKSQVVINDNQPKIVSDSLHNLMLRGMKAVMHNRKGTANYQRIRLNGPDMYGKTGTVQVRRISKEERHSKGGVIKNEDLPWKMRDHALFVCGFPLKKPRYAISVVIEHGGSGSKVATPMAIEIAKKLS